MGEDLQERWIDEVGGTAGWLTDTCNTPLLPHSSLAPEESAWASLWAMTPLLAARKAMNATPPPPADPLAPGPFALADEARLRGILSDAGFGAVELKRFDLAVSLGATPRAAAEGSVRIGPAARFAREMGPDRLPAILDAIERSLASLADHYGQVRVNGSVSASNPA